MSRKLTLRPLAVAAFIFSLAASLFFFWLWYEFYLRIDFNEMGRYFDPENSVVYTDDASVLGIPAFGFLILAGILLTRGFRNSTRRRL